MRVNRNVASEMHIYNKKSLKKFKLFVYFVIFLSTVAVFLLLNVQWHVHEVLVENSAIQESEVVLEIDEDRNPLTIHCNQGRLGNQLCSYATLFGLAALNNRSIQLLPCNHNTLIRYFDIKFPVANMTTFVEKNPHSVDTYFRDTDYHISNESNIVKGYSYPCSFTFFHHVRKGLRKSLTFKSDIEEYAQKALLNVSRNYNKPILVGIHVRRTDFLTPKSSRSRAWLTSFEGRAVDFEYFEKATKFFKDRYKNVLFVVVSDDRAWCRKNLPRFGIHVMEDSPSPGHDMAILANCNHTIMTYGTFSFWSAYLADGDALYYDKFLRPNTDFTKSEFIHDKMYLPYWIGIATKSQWPDPTSTTLRKSSKYPTTEATTTTTTQATTTPVIQNVSSSINLLGTGH